MDVDTDALLIEDNEADRQFEIHYGGHVAVLAYERDEDHIAFLHTGVPRELARHGIAGRLARHGLDYARQTGRTVIPYCPYVESYIEQHPEYQDLVKWPARPAGR